jgi:hypothetical protein
MNTSPAERFSMGKHRLINRLEVLRRPSELARLHGQVEFVGGNADFPQRKFGSVFRNTFGPGSGG